MLVRRTLQFGLAVVVATVVLTVLWNISLGMWDGGLGGGEPTVGGIIASYLLWGRWASLTTLLMFAAVLFVAPFLPGARRAGHMLVAGAAIALVGDLVNLSKVSDIESLAQTNGIPTDLVAGRVVQFSAEAATTYTWAAGAILMGVGLLILSLDAEVRDWAQASAVLGVAFGVMGLTDIGLFGTQDIAWFVALITMAIVFYWLLVALRVTATSGQPLRHRISS